MSGGAEEGRFVERLIPPSESGCVGPFPEGSAFIEELSGAGGWV